MSCRDNLKKQILKAVAAALAKSNMKSAIMIVDDRTTKVLDSCLKVHELNDKGVGVLVNIKYQRERVKVAPIYFLSPSIESIKKMIHDYSNPKTPQYTSNVHLFICGTITKEGMNLIKKARIRKHLKTFQEVYCDFLALESNVFHFNRPESFSKIYMTTDKVNGELQDEAVQLFNALVTMEEDPYIRYAKCSKRASGVASVFQDYYAQMKPKMKGLQTRPNRATLLILDRSQDPVAPLMHEVTYQCMIKDLIATDQKYLSLKSEEKDGATEEKFYFLEDPLWKETRHANMAEVVPDLRQKFKHFEQTNHVARNQKGQKDDNLIATVRDLPKYKKMMKSFTSHFQITKILSTTFTQLQLSTICDVEQNLVTGIDPDGKSVKLKEVQKELTHVLKDPSFPTEIKLRLLLIYIISQGGISDKHKDPLFTAANISRADSEAIFNLTRLGVKIRSDGKSPVQRPPHYKDLQEQAKKLTDKDIVKSRFEPLVSLLLRRLAEDKLSETEYPYLGDRPKTGSSVSNVFGGRSRRRRKGGNDARVFVFVVGGGCFSEVRQCYTLSHEINRDIHIGSSHFMSPKQYIQLLQGPQKTSDDVPAPKPTLEEKED